MRGRRGKGRVRREGKRRGGNRGKEGVEERGTLCMYIQEREREKGRRQRGGGGGGGEKKGERGHLSTYRYMHMYVPHCLT